MEFLLFKGFQFYLILTTSFFQIFNVVNGFKEVEFHVQGDVSGYTKAYINHVIKTVAVILECKEEDIMLNGVRHSESFLLSLSVKEIYISKLLALMEEDRIKLISHNIDYLSIDGENIHLERPRGKYYNMFCSDI